MKDFKANWSAKEFIMFTLELALYWFLFIITLGLAGNLILNHIMKVASTNEGQYFIKFKLPFKAYVLNIWFPILIAILTRNYIDVRSVVDITFFDFTFRFILSFSIYSWVAVSTISAFAKSLSIGKRASSVATSTH